MTTYNLSSVFRSTTTSGFSVFPNATVTTNNVILPALGGTDYQLIKATDGKYYLTRFSTRPTSDSNSVCSNQRSISADNYSNISWLVQNNYIDANSVPPTINNNQWRIYYPVNVLGDFDDTTHAKSVMRLSVDTYHPIIKTNNQSDYDTFCDFVYYMSASSTTAYLAYPSIEIEDTTSGGGGSISVDSSGIINAVLMIPATLIVIGLFYITYRMFINSRNRG